mmetsp:Transcript_46073/g.90808  ORF Transcript_46073/g.90808 Transcript_46073/m.90808 type:complete len:110 (-) Transcript_46073:630-959(-)
MSTGGARKSNQDARRRGELFSQEVQRTSKGLKTGQHQVRVQAWKDARNEFLRAGGETVKPLSLCEGTCPLFTKTIKSLERKRVQAGASWGKDNECKMHSVHLCNVSSRN